MSIKLNIKLLSLVVLVCVFTACSEQKVHVIGISSWGSTATNFDQNIAGFKESLALEGFVEGQNVRYIVVKADLDIAKQIELAEFLVENDVDLIYSIGTQGTLIIKETTKTIPIVFISHFPVESGIIDSMEYSGTNLAGIQSYIPLSKRYENKTYVQKFKKMIFVYYADEPLSQLQYNEFTSFFQAKGVTITAVELKDDEDILVSLPPALERADLIYLACDNRVRKRLYSPIADVALKHKKPLISCSPEATRQGGFASVGVDPQAVGRTGGKMAANILNGANPGQLKIDIVSDEYYVVNLNTAKALGYPINESALAQIDEVIS